jgi:hypothetical protein
MRLQEAQQAQEQRAKESYEQQAHALYLQREAEWMRAKEAQRQYEADRMSTHAPPDSDITNWIRVDRIPDEYYHNVRNSRGYGPGQPTQTYQPPQTQSDFICSGRCYSSCY